MPYILALDQGTTSSRAILFNEAGGIHAVAQREFEQHFPKSGWVEHDPRDIWSSQIAVAAEVIAKAGLGTREIAGIGITNQRETTIAWDRRSGEPVGNAIVWQDRRTADFCDRLAADGTESLIREKTGLRLDPYFSGTKLRWMLEHIDGARGLAEAGHLAFGTVDTWLVWKLTAGRVHATDPSNASRTLMFNIHTGDWDDQLLDLLSIPRSVLPEVRASSGDFGETSGNDLGAPIPISGIAGDQQAALFGQMCVDGGMVKTTYGTGCFMLMNTGTKPVVSDNQLLTTVAWKIGEETTYALEGSIFVGGAVVQWLRDGLGLIKSAPEIEALARKVDDSGGVCFVPAFVGLGAPDWDSSARGLIVGLNRGTTASHLARAALEGLAFQVADVLDAMRADARIDVPQMRVDGGASANNLLMRIQADLLGLPVIRPKTIETTALGAAYLAGLAVGFWKDIAVLRSQWKEDQRFDGGLDDNAIAAARSRWRDAVERSKGWERSES